MEISASLFILSFFFRSLSNSLNLDPSSLDSSSTLGGAGGAVVDLVCGGEGLGTRLARFDLDP